MNRLYFAFACLCLQAVAIVADVPCPFGANLGCVCSGDCVNTTVFQTATCKIAYGASLAFPTPPATYTITEQLLLRGYVWELKENAFQAFRSIGQLTFEQLPAGYVVNWHPEAFQGVKVSKLTAINLNNCERKSEALRNLGRNGLEGLRVVNAYGEEKLNLSAFEMKEFRKLTSLAFEHTPIGNIDDNAFAGLEYNLEELVLVAVELGVYPKNAVQRLGGLRRLDLSDNSMTFPHGSTTFQNLTNLEYLRLSGNDIRAAVRAGAMEILPPTLKALDLDRANLPEVPLAVLKAAPLLERLSLADNFIHILQPHQTSGFPAVSFFDANAGGNETETVQPPIAVGTTLQSIITARTAPPVMPGFTSKLTYLNLDGNPITQIIQGAMAPFPLVTELSMKRTPLIAMDVSSLDGMGQLKNLWMDNSQRLRLFSSSGEGTPSLSRISLVSSALDTIEPDLDKLVSHPGFELLDLSNNEFLLCGNYVHWAAKHVLCQPQRIKVENSRCADIQDKLLVTYLTEAVPNPCGITAAPPPPPPQGR